MNVRRNIAKLKGEANERNKIFEGDVVRLCCGMYGTYEMCILDIRNGFKPIEEEKILEIEIISNIHDNPELLEVK